MCESTFLVCDAVMLRGLLIKELRLWCRPRKESGVLDDIPEDHSWTHCKPSVANAISPPPWVASQRDIARDRRVINEHGITLSSQSPIRI